MMATITKISFFLSKKILLERRRPRLGALPWISWNLSVESMNAAKTQKLIAHGQLLSARVGFLCKDGASDGGRFPDVSE
jgi:hypothetical protein